MSRPWMKFYPSDWRADPALRMCSVGARGLWIEMMCIMHEAEPYGYLFVNGLPVNEKQVASLCGVPLREAVNYLTELEGCGVFSRDENGVIYSRRMKRDQEKAEKDRANGKGGGNPKIRKGVNPPVKPTVGGGDKAQIPDTRIQKEDDEEKPRNPMVTDESNKLADEIALIVGHDLAFVPPAWCGASYTVQKWLAAGWSREIILASVREQMGRRKGDPPDRITYFEKGIAAAIARQNKPLPVVKVIEGDSVNVAAKPENLSDTARRLATAGISFGERPRPIGLGANAGNVRLLPARGSEQS